MKLFIKLTIISLSCIVLNCCKKSSGEQKTCWYLVDPLGYIIPNQVCDKTASEMSAAYGNQYGFFPASDPLFCWMLKHGSDPEFYVRDQPQYTIDKYYPGHVAQKVDCNSFCTWRIYFKHRSKITGLYTPTTLKVETLLNATDTCSTLYPGRIVVVSETTDSIHTAEFIEEL